MIKRFKQLVFEKNSGQEESQAVLITSTSTISYLTGYANFSEGERDAYLFITPTNQYIITDSRYTEEVKLLIPDFEIEERSGNNHLSNILKKLQKKYHVKSLLIEEDVITVSEYKFIQPIFETIIHLDKSILRIHKTKAEILKIKKACQIGDQSFKFILKKIKVGMTEIQIAASLEGFIQKKGATISFDTIVAFGKNAAIPHHHTNHAVLEKNKSGGTFIKMDFGVKFENYCSDMTRTIFLGNPDVKQKKIYKSVLNAQTKAKEYIEKLLKEAELINASMVDNVARDSIIKDGFIPFNHSLGHGIGIEVHEPPTLSPRSEYILEEGMVFSIEPGIYLSGYGGVRIEDLFAIIDGKLIQLTKSSKEIIII